MRLQVPLFARILLWFFLNLLVLGGVFFVLFHMQFQLNPEAPLLDGPGGQLERVARQISDEIHRSSREERDALLAEYSRDYRAEFAIFVNTGEQLCGKPLVLPANVLDRLRERPPRREGPLGDGEDEPPPRPRPFPVFTERSSNPTRYWAGVRIPIFEAEERRPVHATLMIASDSMTGHGLFFNPKPVLLLAGIVVGLSILLWLPFVRHLTRALEKMTAATEQIAEERFDVRVDTGRSDELGRLARAIDHLAVRLDGFVTGQKRFLGDISHELNSPLARMQFALGVLENRIDPAHQSYVEDVQEEVRLMSDLVRELLAYSRAGLKVSPIKLSPVRLRPIIEQVVDREAGGQAVEVLVDPELTAAAQPDLLSRALANLVRNAVRYAGAGGAITISAQFHGEGVRLVIADQGPGVPEEALGKLFDPFYRLEPDRARATGGAGLGLAIVKTCIEACQGTVTARNRTPTGLEIEIGLHGESFLT